MPTDVTPPGSARSTARRLVDDLRAAESDALRPGGIDLGPAVEQVLFHALRDDVTDAPRRPRWARGVRAAATALGPGRVTGGDVLVLVLAGVHARLFAPVAIEAESLRPGLRVAFATAGRAARDPVVAHLPSVERQPSVRDLSALLSVGMDAGRLREATRGWDDELGEQRAEALRRLAAEGVARLGIEGIRLDATLRAARPRVAVTYDEVDAWGRLLCAVAARHDVRVVDLPHAEAVDVDAIRGVAYDAVGVFGPRAADAMVAADVPRERVSVVGPAAFDRLVSRGPAPVEDPPRVLLAAQYRVRGMTDELRAAILEAAIAAARAIGGVVEILPHPTEDPTSWEAVVQQARQDRATVRVVRGARLHDRLPGAGLLVTGWSNSVYEALLAGVPAITVQRGPGEPPMPFAREGMATEIHDADEAADAARTLVADPGRSAAIERARSSLQDHLGPLDGRAARRSAELVVGLLGD